MKKTTVTVKYICDICARESDNSNYDEGGHSVSFGSAKVTLQGSVGSRDCFNNSAGINLSIEKEICFECVRKFLDLLESTK